MAAEALEPHDDGEAAVGVYCSTAPEIGRAAEGEGSFDPPHPLREICCSQGSLAPGVPHILERPARTTREARLRAYPQRIENSQNKGHRRAVFGMG
jgi:hypothetical protein